jgi:phenylalanyl-tRNA synthetase beta chain
MKISYNWLKEYISTDLPVEKIAEILTETGLEVDGIEKIEAVKGALEGVVIGEVSNLRKTP